MTTPVPTPARGALIVIEGLDRAGKSTQCTLLQRRIANSQIIKFPDRTTPTGTLLNTYLTTAASSLTPQTTHLLFSANRWELEPTLRALLAAGTTLICDRYVYSGLAYSLAKGLGYEWCRTADVGLPLPDLVVFLDLPARAGEGRDGWGGERYETSEMQERVRGAFLEVRSREGAEWRIVDAGRGVEAVAEEVGTWAEKVLGEVGGRELGRIV